MIVLALRLSCLSTCFLLIAAGDPIVLTPPRVVVEYGASASANCSTQLTHIGMGWEAPLGAVDMRNDVNLITWKVDQLTEWNIKPVCFINVNETFQHERNLNVTVYKIPDNVSISRDNGLPMIEGRSYELQCNIQNVAPLNNLVVKWYKGQTVVQSNRSSKTDNTPQNELISLRFNADASDDGAEYRCEAQLELGPDGPQSPPSVISKPLIFNVQYSPKFLRKVETFNQTDEEITLNCTVKANPPPRYTWDSPVQKEVSREAVLTVSRRSSGTYNCTARNAQGLSMKQFIIIPQSPNNTTFWVILGVGLAVALMLIVGYIIIRKVRSNSVI